MNIHNLHITEFGLVGTIKLDEWSLISKNQLGTVEFEIGGDCAYSGSELKDTHKSSIEFLINNQSLIKTKLLESIYKDYAFLQLEYGYDEKELIEYMPNVSCTSDIEKLIRITRIHIHDVDYLKTSYIGYEFECTWDYEHGLGFMTHKDRVVACGYADSSILSWIAEEDRDKLVSK